MRTCFARVFYGFKVHDPSAGIIGNLFDNIALGDEDKAIRARLVGFGEVGPEPRFKGSRAELGDREYDKRAAPHYAWQAEVQARLYGCELVVIHDSDESEDAPNDRNRVVYLAIAASRTNLDSEQWAAEAEFKATVEDDWIPRLRFCAALLGLEMRAPSWTVVLW